MIDTRNEINRRLKPNSEFYYGIRNLQLTKIVDKSNDDTCERLYKLEKEQKETANTMNELVKKMTEMASMLQK